MKVQMLGILILTQIRQHASRPVFLYHISRDALDSFEQFSKNWFFLFRDSDERRDVFLWHDDNVHGPEWFRVIKGEDVIGFEHVFDSRFAAQYFVAVEIGHAIMLADLLEYQRQFRRVSITRKAPKAFSEI